MKKLKVAKGHKKEIRTPNGQMKNAQPHSH